MVSFIILSAIEIAAVTAAFMIDVDYVGLKTAAIMTSLLNGLVWIGLLLVIMFPNNVEKGIENELTNGLLHKNKD